MNQLTVIERNNQRVMTTAVLAEEYGTTTDVISKNFNRNKERYTEGKHFYCLEGEEKREFLNHGQFDDGLKNASKLYLWTQKGALLHAKSLGTDRAWEVYEILVDTYFDNSVLLDNLSSEMKAIIMHDKKLQIVATEVKEVKKDLQEFKLDLPLLGVELDKITAAVHSKGVSCLGDKTSPAYHEKSLRSKVYADIYREIKRQFGVSSYKAIKRNQCEMAVEIINAYTPPIVIRDEIDAVNAQMFV